MVDSLKRTEIHSHVYSAYVSSAEEQEMIVYFCSFTFKH